MPRPSRASAQRARVSRRVAVLAAVGACAVLAAACSSNAAAGGPTWVPQPSLGGNIDPTPQLPQAPGPQPKASAPGASSPSNPGGSSSNGTSPAPSSSGAPKADQSVVATNLDQPTGLVVLPDGTALVGERTTGRIYRVQPRAGVTPVLVQTLSGIDGSGDGGLLDLALSPTYDQDNLIYAYVTTATDNRVVHFTLGGTPTPVISGIPKGVTGNAGRIAFDGTGALLTGTGDAGHPQYAEDSSSLAGKILRTNDIGKPMADNPVPGSALYAMGFTSVDGLCVDPSSGQRVAVSDVVPDVIDLVTPGSDFGDQGTDQPAAQLPATAQGGGGCAVVNGTVVVATRAGQSLVATTISSSGTLGKPTLSLTKKYGRLRTVVAGSDGALWLTTSNLDGHGTPVATDDRVIRISASAAGGGSVL